MRSLRRLRGYSQSSLAERTRRTQARVAAVEGRGDPQLSTILALTEAMRAVLVPVPIEYLAEVERLLDHHDRQAPPVERVPNALEDLFLRGDEDDDA
ncbi:helix-turn-helix domain-containing protein [Azospirillum argentinense]|uniref:XRE family transcriptional regulator n=1 Tax=Azospirillum brasilense TaxID=192 RepID=A0A4D8Q0T2_AZOBR|nr:helix-turn-helix transcriptional regulator [Azospirillum argentinense]QCO03715.1 XRE family transcriptional regulator [Azospirillum argentinense]